MSDQIIDIIDVGIPGGTGDVTPEVIAARDAAIEARDEAVFAAEHSGNLASASASTVPANDPADVELSGPLDARNAHFNIPRGLPGSNAIENDEAVAAYVAASDSATRGAVDSVVQTPSTSINLVSPADRLADTKRLRIVSSQKQEAENNWDGGEVAWFDLEDPLAKAMLTWRLRFDPTTREVYPQGEAPSLAPYRRVVWAGAHWFAQDQPDDNNPTVIHGHWSVETPRPNGQLHTRFQIFFNDRSDPSKVGSEVALISTNLADFMVERNMSADGVTPAGRFILAGSHSMERGITFARGGDHPTHKRWFMGAMGDTESSGNVGASFVLHRYDDAGESLGISLKVLRATGTITLGSDHAPPASAPAQVFLSGDGGEQNSLVILPRYPLTGNASAIRVRVTSLAQKILASQIGSAGDRFAVTAGGRIEWGDGSTVGTVLYEDTAGRLKTDAAFAVGGGLRVAGALTEGGGNGLIAINNAITIPTANNASGGLLYVQGGALKYRGSTGTVTTIGPA